MDAQRRKERKKASEVSDDEHNREALKQAFEIVDVDGSKEIGRAAQCNSPNSSSSRE